MTNTFTTEEVREILSDFQEAKKYCRDEAVTAAMHNHVSHLQNYPRMG
jgi:hypothetical protein